MGNDGMDTDLGRSKGRRNRFLASFKSLAEDSAKDYGKDFFKDCLKKVIHLPEKDIQKEAYLTRIPQVDSGYKIIHLYYMD